MKINDFHLWEALKSTVQPFVGVMKNELPPRLKVRHAIAKDLSFILDLHHKTVQEAYDTTLHFLTVHYKQNSKKVQIITGKGYQGKGAIKTEFAGWLDTKSFKKYIQRYEWTNDQGAVNLWLRKNK